MILVAASICCWIAAPNLSLPHETVSACGEGSAAAPTNLRS